jgi:hypothetical protein
LWSLQELLDARKHILGYSGNVLSEVEVTTRYYQYGGVPGHIFGDGKNLDEAQDLAIEAAKDKIKSLVSGKMDVIGNFAPNLPKSILLGLVLQNPDGDVNEKYERYRSVIISRSVRAKIAAKFDI